MPRKIDLTSSKDLNVLSNFNDFLKKIGNQEAIKGSTIIDIHQLQAALNAGGSFCGPTNVEDLDAVLKNVSFDDKKIKLHRN